MPAKPKTERRIFIAITESLGLSSDEDSETIRYLAKEILTSVDVPPVKNTTVTPEELTGPITNAVGELLVEFGYAESEEDASRISHDIAKKLRPNMPEPTPEPSEEEKEEQKGDNSGSDEDENDPKAQDGSVCALCSRPMPLTFHHLIPRRTHRKLSQTKYRERGLTKEDALSRGLMVCRPCHSAIHRIFTHEELALTYNTLEALEEDERVRKWVAYAEKQKFVEKQHALWGLRYSK